MFISFKEKFKLNITNTSHSSKEKDRKKISKSQKREKENGIVFDQADKLNAG